MVYGYETSAKINVCVYLQEKYMKENNDIRIQDPSNFRQMIFESPDQFRIGFELGKNLLISGRYDSIEISGMGGSALPGNLLRTYLGDLYAHNGSRPIAIYQNRTYTLPHESTREGCLNIFCSYSGNTEETLSAFEESMRRGNASIGISVGGKLEKLCHERNIPHIKLPMPFPDFQPRVGTGYFFGAIFGVLVKLNMAIDTCDTLIAEAEEIGREMSVLEERGKILAEKLMGRTPVVYSTTTFKSVAMVWKIKFNENAKIPAFWNFFPELNHNEMVGFTHPNGKFSVLMLSDPDMDGRIRSRFDKTAQLLSECGVAVESIDMGKGNVFTKMFRTIFLGDFTSYHLAIRSGVNPTPVDMVEKLKQLLADKENVQ